MPNEKNIVSKKVENDSYPFYPESEDIYSKSQNMVDVNPEDPTHKKAANADQHNGANNEKDFKDDVSGGDLDVPGSELDDTQLKPGSEDEENNFYSLGGDDHENLDEDKGD